MAPTTRVCYIITLFHLVTLTPLILLEEEYEFKQWMSEYNRKYGLEEYYHRLQIFIENKRKIDQHNAGKHSFTMGLNQFSDMTFVEFKESFLLTEKQNCSATKGSHISSNDPYPDHVDWRERGNFVTPVKSQGFGGRQDSHCAFACPFCKKDLVKGTKGLVDARIKLVGFSSSYKGHCGSCWTFSTTGCLESVTAIATGKLLLLSEQQLVDCAQDFNNHGCMGGLPSQAFEYIKYSNGLMTEDDYPYEGHDSTCKFKPQLAAAFVNDVVNITSYDENSMVDAVATRNPVSFGYQVTADFVHYKEGIYTSTLCKNTTDTVNHAVLAVGFGEENGTLFWIVKNSWSAKWGMEGYFLIERGHNMCGLAACSSYPSLFEQHHQRKSKFV